MELISCVMIVGCALIEPPDSGSWTFSSTSRGENFSWTSPAPIRADGGHYEMLFTVNSANVMVSYIGIPFGPIDVTDMIPADSLETWRSSSGPCPLDFGWIEVIFPEDQFPSSLSYDWIVEINGKGYVTYRMENVFTGQADYDLGWPWGTVTVNIESGTIIGLLNIDLVTAPCYGDIDGDGVVDVVDLLEVIGNWGFCIGCPADTNQDDMVDVTDLLLIVGSCGLCPS